MPGSKLIDVINEGRMVLPSEIHYPDDIILDLDSLENEEYSEII
jgi:hypothetical protein